MASRTLACLLALPALVAPAMADAAPPATQGQLIVRFAPGADAGDRAAARSDASVRLEKALPLPGLQLVEPASGQSTSSAAKDLERSDDVVYAEPNLLRQAAVVPNDPYFGNLWGAAAIDAPEAWDVTTGSPSVTAAVIDTGVDSTHPDLASRIASNPGETGSGRETNGVDDDGNGYVDDWRGWDFVQDDNLPADENGHGTHVSGTIAAAGNNGVGVTGVSWNSHVMPVRVLDAAGTGSVADLISAYHYAVARGIRVINLSLGGSGFSNAERDVIASAPDTLFVVAAGNGGSDQVGDDVDATPQYPCAYPLANIVCVAASSQEDGLTDFSNYGRTTVDLAAPGERILSTVPGGYAYYDGTSMATPMVTGAAALILSARPGATASAVKADLLGGVDPKPAFASSTVSGGRLNADRSVRDAAGVPEPTPAPPATGAAPPASAAPPPRPSPVPRRDRTAPRIYLGARAHQRLRLLPSRGLLLRARCSERCTLRVQLTFRGARSAARRTVATARVRLSSTGKVVRVRLSRAGRRLLRKHRPRAITVVTVAKDAAGNTRTRSLRVALSR